jgi:hypothetical protein
VYWGEYFEVKMEKVIRNLEKMNSEELYKLYNLLAYN